MVPTARSDKAREPDRRDDLSSVGLRTVAVCRIALLRCLRKIKPMQMQSSVLISHPHQRQIIRPMTMNKLFTTAASETTPLSSIPAIIGDPRLKELASSKEIGHVKELASAAMSRGKDLYQAASKGSTSLRTLVTLTALAISITSFMGLTSSLLSLNLTGAVLAIYCTIFGLIAALIELDKDKNPFGVRRIISTYFHFLDFPNGKSVFYIFLGTLKIAQGDIVSWAIGGFMCFVGFLYFTVSQVIAQKIKSLRQKMYSEDQLQTIFNKADKDGDKKLNMEEFNKVIGELGLKLEKREAEVAFDGVDINNDGLIDFHEFYENFWKNGAFNETKFQFAFAV